MVTYEVCCHYDSKFCWNEISTFFPFLVCIFKCFVILRLFSEEQVEIDVTANDGDVVDVKEEEVDGHDFVDCDVVFSIGIQACLEKQGWYVLNSIFVNPHETIGNVNQDQQL